MCDTFSSYSRRPPQLTPHLYAAPLYVDRVTMSAGAFAGSSLPVVYAASSNGFVYAVNAAAPARGQRVAPGAILWKTELNIPSGSLDGGIPLGVLGTPVIDLAAKTLYVASADINRGWRVFALDITSGGIRAGWLRSTSVVTAPPCIVKLRIVTTLGSAAYLAVEASENTLGFLSPGSPSVTSNGPANAIVRVLVGSLGRSASLTDTNAPHPILYALDPVTLKPLWTSTPAMLNVGGDGGTPGSSLLMAD